MINSKDLLRFYIMADTMMNKGVFHYTTLEKIKRFFLPDYIMLFLKCLRCSEYYYNTKEKLAHRLMYVYYQIRTEKLGMKLGFTIPKNVFGYGLVIPHHGTIVVGGGNTIGNYCVLHTSICITAGKKQIGDAFYVSTGAKVIHDVCIPDNVSVGANSLVTSSVSRENTLLVGCPAAIKKEMQSWYIRDGSEFNRRHDECERLKNLNIIHGRKLCKKA